MYTETDKKIADDILNEIKRSIQIEKSTMYEKMNRYYGLPRDAPEFELKCCNLWNDMESKGLIKIANNRMTLTNEGHLAANIGIDKYFKDCENHHKLDLEVKRTTIWNNKVSVLVGLSSIISFIVGVLLSEQVKKVWSYFF